MIHWKCPDCGSGKIRLKGDIGINPADDKAVGWRGPIEFECMSCFMEGRLKQGPGPAAGMRLDWYPVIYLKEHRPDEVEVYAEVLLDRVDFISGEVIFLKR